VVVEVVVEPITPPKEVVVLVVLVVVMVDMPPLGKIKMSPPKVLHILDQVIVLHHHLTVGVEMVMVVTVHVVVEVVEHLMHHRANLLPVRHQHLISPPVHIQE
tara:strand:+ start:436 stop:744 length:309 start_codon:yes stop_codon:yes gene_type:complete